PTTREIVLDEVAAQEEPIAPAPEAPVVVEERTAVEKAPSSFSWTAFMGGLAALGWLAAAIGLPVSYFGIDALARMHPAMQAGLVALAFGPTILIWLGAAAVGEAAKAGKLAAELTKLAREAILPAQPEAASERFTLHVKNEIEQLNQAVEGAFQRLQQLEGAASRQALAFEQAISVTRDDAFTSQLAGERAAFAELNAELKGQTESLAHTIGRHVRLMREASTLVKTELGDAEEALETHLSSFRATADVLGQRTAEMNDAAHVANVASGRLDETMGQALDTLTEASRLTDAALRSTEQAVEAAHSTADAVSQTTQRAIGDAKRAADLIRSETQAMQDAAEMTLATLAEAAQAARIASEDAQAAADRHASSIEKRLSALAMTAATAKKAPRTVQAPVVEAPVVEEAPVQSVPSLADVAADMAPAPARKGWQGLPMRKAQEEDLVAFAPKVDANRAIVDAAFDVIADAGVLLEETLNARDLDEVAAASRNGAQARRRSVLDCAPVAVTRIARFVRRDQSAKDAACAFRARPDLAKADRASGRQDVIRAYLLIDAALA
ncbi:MAG: hypothetical protein AB7T08_02695, partial [Hyphomonadaceae bacterium]